MRRPTLRLAAAALAGLCLLPATPVAAAETGPRVEEVAPGVFAVLQPHPRRFNQSNSLFVLRGKGVLVVDTQSSLAATREVIREIRARTELPVRHLVLTHWHGDHVQGIAAYREAWPGVEVIGHASLAADIRERAEPQAEEEIAHYEEAIAAAEKRLQDRKDRQGEPLSEESRRMLAAQIRRARETVEEMEAIPRPFAVPDRTYEGELRLAPDRASGDATGPGEIRLIHLRAHTRGDSIVHLPAARVVFTGDVLDDLPFGGHGYPASWVAALERIAALEPRVVVPGHGSVRRSRIHLDLVLRMFRSLVEQVGAAVANGLDLQATRAAVDLDDYHRRLTGNDAVASRAWDNFMPPTVERAWLEARGEFPD